MARFGLGARVGAAALGLVLGGPLPAQTVDSVGVQKTIQYVQTSAAQVAPQAYYFSALVLGNGLGSLSPAPTVTGPINTALLGSSFNGTLSFSGAGRGWDVFASYASRPELDARFGSGTYTIHVNGGAVPVQLNGDDYPDAPMLSFSQGSWVDGKFYFDRARPLTITTNAFASFAPNDTIFFSLMVGSVTRLNVVQHHGDDPTNAINVTVPANTFAEGDEIRINTHFSNAVDQNLTALPGVYGGSAYGAQLGMTMVAQAPPQVFPMTVTSNIGAVTSTATAQIQPRPQDVGQTASVFVFAVAPSNRVINASQAKAAAIAWKAEGATRDTPVQCVLAQLNSSGQLQVVSASSLQAYVSGTLSAQGQAVTILNGVPTVNIGGATFYVGYGANASSMINNGINQRAVAVPGDITCDPKPPKTGWWWNPAEGGRGYSIEVTGNHIFFASYLYDATGRAMVVGPYLRRRSVKSAPARMDAGERAPDARLEEAVGLARAIDLDVVEAGVAPLTVTIVAADGRSRSARIEVGAERLRMMN